MRVFFKYGDAETKSDISIAMAELAVSHNRWYVMDVLLDICGKSLDDASAERISIDIVAFEVQNKFANCASDGPRTIDAYHRAIRRVLTN